MRSAKRKIKITVLLERGGYFTFMDTITINNIFFIICMCTSKKVYPIKGYTFFLFGNPICFSGKEEKH